MKNKICSTFKHVAAIYFLVTSIILTSNWILLSIYFYLTRGDNWKIPSWEVLFMWLIVFPIVAALIHLLVFSFSLKR